MSKKITQKEYKSKILDKTNGEYEVISEYRGMDKPIRILHHKCNKFYELKNASCAYYHSVCCPHCRFFYVDEDYPELVKNFKDQSKTHIVKSSKEEIELICPCCGKIVRSDVAHYIRMGHVPCDSCNDGYSYPEKYIANLLDQLNIIYIHQFSPNWAGKYRYDFQFDYNKVSYILEVDGGIGHGYHDAYGNDRYDKLQIDIEKEELAYHYGYNVLRIDCNYENHNRAIYIQEHIQHVLSNIFDLSNVNWEQCSLYASNSLFQKVIDIYKTQTKYKDEIAEIANIKVRTVIKYLADAMNSGLIPKEIIHSKPKLDNAIGEPKWNNLGSPVYCYEDALVFQTITEAEKYYCMCQRALYTVLTFYNGFYKGRHFVYYKDLPKDFDFKPVYFPETNKSISHMIAQYTMNGDLYKIHFRITDYVSKEQYENIKRCCRGERKTAYGYQWKYISKRDEFEIIHLVTNKNAQLRSYLFS